MVTITNIRNTGNAAYDEVWAIVRSLKNPDSMKHVLELSPSWGLFKKYLALRDAGRWDADTFQKVYVPVFMKEMQTAVARRKLAELTELDRHGKHICLACFCADEATCHRSIIAGILQSKGIAVNGVSKDYSVYGRAFV